MRPIIILAAITAGFAASELRLRVTERLPDYKYTQAVPQEMPSTTPVDPQYRPSDDSSSGCQCPAKCGKTDCNCTGTGSCATTAPPSISIDHEALTAATAMPNDRVSRRVQWLVFTSKTCVPCEQAKRDYVPYLQPVGWTFSYSDESSHFLYRDIDAFPELVSQHKITQIPTFVLMVDGNQLKRHEAYPGKQALASEFIAATAILPPSTGGLFGPVKIGTIARSLLTQNMLRVGKAGVYERKDSEYAEQISDGVSVTIPANCTGKWSDGRYEFSPNITVHASGWDQECKAITVTADRVLFELPKMIDCYLGIENAETLSADDGYDYDVHAVSSTPRSPHWPAVRAEHLRKHPVCEACGTVDHLNVHHVEPFHLHPEKELDPTNFVTLCRLHHFTIGHDPDGAGPLKPNWKAENPNVREDSKRMRMKLNPNR